VGLEGELRGLGLKWAALCAAFVFALGACGGSTANPVDPVGGVAAAFDSAKAGGTLKAMDLVTCLTTGGTLGSSFSGLFGGLTGDAMAKAGISVDDLNAAWKISFDNLQTTEKSRSGDNATVQVTVKVASQVDAGKMRDLVKKYSATQGIVPDDATIDAAIQAKLGGQLTMSETIDKDVRVVQQGGKWVACGGSPIAAGATPTTGQATVAPTAASTQSPPPAPSGPTGGSAIGNAVAIVAGSAHNCALLSDGSVKCWGTNSGGQLGNGTTTSSDTAVNVTGLSSGVTAISSWAGTYSCALTTGGGVKCWGTGAVGNGSTTPTTAPADVVGLTSGVSALSAANDHACAVTSGGGVKCWGVNSTGQLGDGSTTTSSAPVGVASLGSGATAVAAGDAYSCALTSGGGVKCWGNNSAGQLGNGSTTSSPVPVEVAGLSSGVRAIAAGESYTCALMSSGGVKCWGGTLSIPTDITGISGGISAIYPAIQIACVSLDAGGLKCWSGNQQQAAADVPGLDSSAKAVAFGSQSTFCVLMSQGGVICAHGSTWAPVVGLAAGSANGSSSPAASGNTTAIAIGFQHACALSASGGVKCWGYNDAGPLGNGSTKSSDSPVDVFGLTSGVAQIGASFGYSCAVTTAGGVKCWGRNDYGQLGNGAKANSLIPVDVSGLSGGISSITMGLSHTCALSTSGAVTCWGQNGSRQLGNGASADSLVPVAVSKLGSGVKAIDARNQMTCAVTAAGGVKCWGTGILGNGLTGNAALRNEIPADIVGATSGITAVALGAEHTCLLTSAGVVKCLGVNQEGELGNGIASPVFPYVPADVPGLGGVTAIDAGKTHTCALSSGGGVKCWGGNSQGQLGNGTKANNNSPVDVAGLSSGITSIQAGEDSTCAITSAGAVKCWGGTYGTTPVDVAGL
jgi:alpha-tubulin suppressor-like RCC1 family protein